MPPLKVNAQLFAKDSSPEHLTSHFELRQGYIVDLLTLWFKKIGTIPIFVWCFAFLHFYCIFLFLISLIFYLYILCYIMFLFDLVEPWLWILWWSEFDFICQLFEYNGMCKVVQLVRVERVNQGCVNKFIKKMGKKGFVIKSHPLEFEPLKGKIVL